MLIQINDIILFHIKKDITSPEWKHIKQKQTARHIVVPGRLFFRWSVANILLSHREDFGFSISFRPFFIGQTGLDIT